MSQAAIQQKTNYDQTIIHTTKMKKYILASA